MSYPDFEEFLESLNDAGVRYLVVGAHAVAFHAQPRATKDLDLYLDAGPENAERTLQAIRRFFGGADLGLTVEDLSDPESIIQLGVTPVRIDLLSSLSGISSFQEAWDRRVEGEYGFVKTQYLALDDLILEKQRAGREQDKADVAVLLKAKARQ